MTKAKRVEIIPNYNPDLHSICLNADKLYYSAIIAWWVNLEYEKENPHEDFFVYAVPITADDGANDRDNYAILNRKTNEWWIPNERSGSNLEELKTLVAQHNEAYLQGLSSQSTETEPE